MAHPNKVKGRAFELKIVHLLKVIWATAKRGIQFRDGGKEAGDIEGVPLHFECSKGGESIWAKWKQALADAKHRKMVPVVIKQRDWEQPVVMLDLMFFLYMVDPSMAWLPAYFAAFPGAEIESNHSRFPKLP